jgi:hypothetical protein
MRDFPFFSSKKQAHILYLGAFVSVKILGYWPSQITVLSDKKPFFNCHYFFDRLNCGCIL